MYKICIAEDEYYVQRSLESRIKRLPFDLKIDGFASNGEEAVELYYKNNPDIFLVDINMPGSDGFHLIEKAKEDLNNRTIFIIISGYSDFKYMKKAIQCSTFDYIKKPIIQEELEDVIKRAIKKLNEEKVESFLLSKEYTFCDEFSDNIDNKKLDGTICCVYGPDDNNFIESAEFVRLYTNLKGLGEFKIILVKNLSSICIFYYKDQYISLDALKKISHKFNQDTTGIFINSYLNKDDFDIIINQIQESLYKKFFQHIYFLSLKSIGHNKNNKYLIEELEFLNCSIKQENVADFEKQIKCNMQQIKEEENNYQLNTYYHQVILLLISKYIKNNLNDSESLRRELLPFSLLKYGEYSQIVDGLCEMGKELITSISKKMQSMDLISKICVYLHNNYRENITLNDLSNQFFVSPGYLSHYFKNKKDITIVKYLQEIRMSKAKEYLEETHIAISDVAELVGYADSNYFSKVFRKKFKMTPSEYREKL